MTKTVFPQASDTLLSDPVYLLDEALLDKAPDTRLLYLAPY